MQFWSFRRWKNRSKLVSYREWDVQGNYLGFRWLNPRLQRFPYLRSTPEYVLRQVHRRAVFARRIKMRERRLRLAKAKEAAQVKAKLPKRTKFDQVLLKRIEKLGLEASNDHAPLLLVLLLEQMHTRGKRCAPVAVIDECAAVMQNEPRLRGWLLRSVRQRRFEELRDIGTLPSAADRQSSPSLQLNWAKTQ